MPRKFTFLGFLGRLGIYHLVCAVYIFISHSFRFIYLLIQFFKFLTGNLTAGTVCTHSLASATEIKFWETGCQPTPDLPLFRSPSLTRFTGPVCKLLRPTYSCLDWRQIRQTLGRGVSRAVFNSESDLIIMCINCLFLNATHRWATDTDTMRKRNRRQS